MRKTLKDIPVLNWFIRILKFSMNANDRSNAVYVLTHKIFGENITLLEAKMIVQNKDFYKSALYEKMLKFKLWCNKSSSIENAYEYFNIDNYINPTSASYAENKGYIKTLLENIDFYIAMKEVSLIDGISEYINSSALYGIDILQDDIHLNNNTVKLMTLHASKGLEFKYVYIIGLNPGLMPLNTKTVEEQDEEKRLFFVGITRAKDYLEISYYTSPDDLRVSPVASSYISMIPANLVERDEDTNNKVSLNNLRREVALENKNIDCLKPLLKKMIKHEKYGIGTVESEDENTITAYFEGYGVKEFLKMFGEIEYV